MNPLRVYLVDDEPLALKGMTRLLHETGRVEITGSTTEPAAALEFLSAHDVDALFLDVQMPGMTGFDLLKKLPSDPFVVFTTAYDRFALQAFAVNSVDYLLKPIDRQHLDRALTKLERMRGSAERGTARASLESIVEQLTRRYPTRIASRSAGRVTLVDLATVTHFYAKDGLTFAATASRDYVVDSPIGDLEQRLDPAVFVRIHRRTLVNVAFVGEVHTGFGGGLELRLKDSVRDALPVSRERVRVVKEKLGLG